MSIRLRKFIVADGMPFRYCADFQYSVTRLAQTRLMSVAHFFPLDSNSVRLATC